MRFFLISILFLTSLFASKIDSSLIENRELKDSFNKFWDFYLKSDAESMYNQEAPYFKYLYDFGKYKSYVNTLKKLKGVKVKSIDKFFNRYKITLVILNSNDKESLYYDWWIKVNDKFYHKTFLYTIFNE